MTGISGPDPILFVSVVPAGTKTAERIDLSERVITWGYEDDESKADKLSLQIDNFDLSMLDAPILAKGNTLVVQWGYPGNMSPERECVITSTKGGIVLTVEALALSVLMNKHKRVRTFEHTKRSEVAIAIAEENGFGEDVQIIDDTIEILEQITQARMTDAELMRDMAKREGWEFFTDFDGFHFHPRRLGQKPRREFIYYTDPGEGDVISWSIENDIYVGKAGGVTVQGRDPLKKKNIEVKADNSTSKDRKTLAPVVELFTGISARDGTEGTTVARSKDAGSSTILPTTAKTEADAKKHAGAVFAKGQLAAIVLTMEAKGDPQMIAKSLARVSGIGPTLSGNYYVKTVQHKGGTGYTMTMKMRRDGKSQASNTAGPAPKSGADTKGVPAQGSTNAAAPPKKAPDGSPPADLEAVSAKDGTTTYRDGRGRSNGSNDDSGGVCQ